MAVSKNQKLYSYLDQLSTQELEVLLQKEAEILSDDPNMAMYILEVMEKREGGLTEADKENTARAWEEFLADYATPEGDGLQLYPSDDAGDKSEAPAPEKSSRIKNRYLHIVRRLAVVAAMLACAFLLTACSVGGIERFFRMVGSWTAEVFTFENKYKGEVSEEVSATAIAQPEVANFDGMMEALAAYGISEQVFPVVANGFELSTIDVLTLGEEKVLFYALYDSSDHYMVHQAILHGEPGSMIFEKDDTEVVEYSHNSIVYYVYSNSNSHCVTWFSGNLECLIDSDLPKEELLELIDSIQ